MKKAECRNVSYPLKFLCDRARVAEGGRVSCILVLIKRLSMTIGTTLPQHSYESAFNTSSTHGPLGLIPVLKCRGCELNPSEKESISIGWDGSSVNVNAQRRRVKVMNMDRSAMYMPRGGISRRLKP
jgi:hypothetical protein